MVLPAPCNKLIIRKSSRFRKHSWHDVLGVTVIPKHSEHHLATVESARTLSTFDMGLLLPMDP